MVAKAKDRERNTGDGGKLRTAYPVTIDVSCNSTAGYLTTDDMVEDCPGFKEVYIEFAQFAAGAVLLAHNARFDTAFLTEETRRNQLPPPDNEILDTLALFRKWFPESPRYSLEGLIDHLQLDGGILHRALADAHYIVRILEAGLAERPRVTSLGALEKDAGGALEF